MRIGFVLSGGRPVDRPVRGDGRAQFPAPRRTQRWPRAVLVSSRRTGACGCLNDRVARACFPAATWPYISGRWREIGGLLIRSLYQSGPMDVGCLLAPARKGFNRIGFNPCRVCLALPPVETWRAYLKQQRGYGEAEALLVRKHPEYFNSLGGERLGAGRFIRPPSSASWWDVPLFITACSETGSFQTLYASAAPPGPSCSPPPWSITWIVTLPLLGAFCTRSTSCCQWP